jgi:hypothetical protein
MLDPGNPYCFDYALRHLPSASPVLEIGSFCGLSTNVIAHFMRKLGVPNTFITSEPWIFEGAGAGAIGRDGVTHEQYRDFVRGTFLRNVQFFSADRLPHTVELPSDRFFEAWRGGDAVADVFGREVRLGGRISFAYIDGNHTYDYARRDFENCDAFLDPGGFILFDDSADSSTWDVRRVVREALDSGRYELVVKNPNYLIRRRV